MNVAVKFPSTIEDRYELGPGVVRFEATWEEYLDLLEEADYNIEYQNNEIIAMSIASDPHETVVINLGTCLSIAARKIARLSVKGSNRHVFIKQFEADYSPDLHAVLGKPEIYPLRKGLSANLNPWLVVEVMSPSTRGIDWNEKLPRFKQIPGLRYILYVEQDRPVVSLFSRPDDATQWARTDYDQLEQSFEINGQPISLEDIYWMVLLKDN